MDNKNELLVRVYFVMCVFILFAIAILFRVIKIATIEGDKWRSKGDVYVKWKEKEVDRGDIYDANGNLLATSLPFFDIRMDLVKPTDAIFNSNIDSLAISLNQLWPYSKSAAEWKSELMSGRIAGLNKSKQGMSYYYIANGVSLDELEKLKKFPLFRHGQFGGGFIVVEKSKREKPFREIASRTIGEDRENAEKIGIEGSFDKFLRGKTTKQLMKRIPPNLWVPVMNPGEFDAKKGDDIITTLDIHIQDIVHTELLKGVIAADAKAGTAILMEVETGAIKAISNLERSEKDGSYSEAYNYGIGHRSEPGSTLKLATIMAILEDSCFTLNHQVNVGGGKRKFYDRWMYDSDMHGKVSMTISEGFKVSSNIVLGAIADECFGANWERKADFCNYFEQFGLTEVVDIEIEGEKNPLIKHPHTHRANHMFWKTTVPWMAHGYEMELTPIQVLAFYNAVANGGRKMKPYLVEEILRDGKTIHHFKPKATIEQIASEETIIKAQELLKGVVQSGTARRLKSDEFTFAGKTGTTRIQYNNQKGADRNSGEKKKYNASFAGYFPAENPKYSMIVVMYEPEGSIYGAQVAGPVFSEVAEKCHSFFFKNELAERSQELKDFMIEKKQSGYAVDYDELMAYMDVDYNRRSNSKWVELLPSEEDVSMEKKKILKSEVPDVRGMGLRDALYILESIGMRVKISGVGRVSTQTIRPGTKNVGQEIELYLN